MKKTLILVLVVMLCGIAFAEWTRESLTPVYQARTANGLTLYVVGGSTTATATCMVGTSSITITTTAGLYPGTTYFIFSQSNKDTLAELITYINAMSITGVGSEGGIIASRVQGSYGENPSTQLSVVATATCFEEANEVTLAFDNILGMSYILPANLLAPELQFHITDLIVNATWVNDSSETCYVSIYDGTTTATRLSRQRVPTSAYDYPIKVTSSGYMENSENTAMRFDVVSSTWITAGYIDITGNKK